MEPKLSGTSTQAYRLSAEIGPWGSQQLETQSDRQANIFIESLCTPYHNSFQPRQFGKPARHNHNRPASSTTHKQHSRNLQRKKNNVSKAIRTAGGEHSVTQREHVIVTTNSEQKQLASSNDQNIQEPLINSALKAQKGKKKKQKGNKPKSKSVGKGKMVRPRSAVLLKRHNAQLDPSTIVSKQYEYGLTTSSAQGLRDKTISGFLSSCKKSEAGYLTGTASPAYFSTTITNVNNSRYAAESPTLPLQDKQVKSGAVPPSQSPVQSPNTPAVEKSKMSNASEATKLITAAAPNTQCINDRKAGALVFAARTGKSTLDTRQSSGSSVTIHINTGGIGAPTVGNILIGSRILIRRPSRNGDTAQCQKQQRFHNTSLPHEQDFDWKQALKRAYLHPCTVDNTMTSSNLNRTYKNLGGYVCKNSSQRIHHTQGNCKSRGKCRLRKSIRPFEYFQKLNNRIILNNNVQQQLPMQSSSFATANFAKYKKAPENTAIKSTLV